MTIKKAGRQRAIGPADGENARDLERLMDLAEAAATPCYGEKGEDLGKSFALAETPGANVRFVDLEFNEARREAICRIEKGAWVVGTRLSRRNADLVDIATGGIGCDEPRRPAGGVRGRRRSFHPAGQMGAQALNEPRPMRLEVDRKSGLAPGRDPDVNERRQVAFVEVA